MRKFRLYAIAVVLFAVGCVVLAVARFDCFLKRLAHNEWRAWPGEFDKC
jgi:hypothetical protein